MKRKRILCIILSMVMVIVMMPVAENQAYAAGKVETINLSEMTENFVFCAGSTLVNDKGKQWTLIFSNVFPDSAPLQEFVLNAGTTTTVQSTYSDKVSNNGFWYVMYVDTNYFGICPASDEMVAANVVYNITFDAQGGSSSISSAETEKGGKLASLPTPTRANYDFLGWFTQASGGTQITTGTTFTQDTKVYAQWKLQHNHSWEYTASGNAITAHCTASNCPIASDQTLTVNAGGGTYNGNSYIASVVKSSDFPETASENMTISYSGILADGTNYPASADAPKQAGNYTVTVKIDTAEAKKDFSINVANQSGITADMGNYYYNQAVSTPALNGTILDSTNIEAVFYYNTTGSNTGGTQWKNITGTTLEPDTYYIYAVLPATNNCHEFTTPAVSFQVVGEDMGTVTASNVTVDYNGGFHGIEVMGYPQGADIVYGTSDGFYTQASCPQYSQVTETPVTIYYKVTASGYNPVTGSATLTINPKQVELEWGDTALTYNGTAQHPEVTVKEGDLIQGDSCGVTVEGGQTDYSETPYTAQVVGLDNSNYKLPQSNITKEFTIGQKEIGVTWSNKDLIYNGMAQKPDAVLNGVLPQDTCDVEVMGEMIAAGTGYTAEATISNNNYKLKDTDKNITFNIAPKTITKDMILFDSSDNSYIYTGNTISPLVTVKDGNVTLVAGEEADYVISGTDSETKFGTYRLKVTGKGNYQGEVSVEWKITDPNPPMGNINISTNNWNCFLNDVTFGHFFKNTQTVIITGEDNEGESGIDKIYYYESENALSNAQIAAVADEQWTEVSNGKGFDISPDARLVIYAKITDKSGNITYISSDGLVLDGTAPTVTGITDGMTYCETQTVTVGDSNLDKVTVNGEAVTLTDGKYILDADNTAYTIVATDKAGNSTTVKVTVNDGHTWKEPVITWAEDNGSATAAFVCENDSTHVKKIEGRVDGSVTKKAEGTQKGEITYTAVFEFEGRTYTATKQVEVPVIEKEEVGNGSISTEVAIASDLPVTSIDNLTVELAKQLLTETELEAVRNGNDIVVYLEATNINETVTLKDKEFVENQLDALLNMYLKKAGLTSKEEVNAGIQYIDLSLWKKNGSDMSKIIDTGDNEISVTVAIPDNMKSNNEKCEYFIIRVHGTEVTVLPTIYDSVNNTLTFKSGRFSTYAIVYAEPNGFIVEEDSNEEDSQTTANASVKTGDATPLTALFTMLILSGAGICALGMKSRRKEETEE